MRKVAVIIMFRVAIIGCGGIAQVHAAVLDKLPETELIACADIRPERADAMAEKYGCRAYSSMEALLDAETPDSVHLCTPHCFHAPMAKAAADRGIAVFSEKPPVISREQWGLLEEAASKVPFGVCFQNRYNPNVEEARRLIREGEYGALLGGTAATSVLDGVTAATYDATENVLQLTVTQNATPALKKASVLCTNGIYGIEPKL